jgi:hypothetical protein
MGSSKYELLSAEEAAQILGITLKKLYKICDIFDSHNDDQWESFEGEHFEWLRKNLKTRRFYEEGAMAIAKYIQETDTSSLIAGFIDAVVEKITHRRKRVRQMLVRRRIILELQDLSGVKVQNDLVFIERLKVIRILDTNGKGLNAAAQREQDNDSLVGREPMEIGVHFNDIKEKVYFDGIKEKKVKIPQYWSQRGIARIAQNMSENMDRKKACKSRKAWTDAVCEVVEDAIEHQRKYLDSFDARVQKAMNQVKSAANHRCQVTLAKQAPDIPFDLHAHHLFDRSTRKDLADFHDNLLGTVLKL